MLTRAQKLIKPQIFEVKKLFWLVYVLHATGIFLNMRKVCLLESRTPCRQPIWKFGETFKVPAISWFLEIRKYYHSIWFAWSNASMFQIARTRHLPSRGKPGGYAGVARIEWKLENCGSPKLLIWYRILGTFTMNDEISFLCVCLRLGSRSWFYLFFGEKSRFK